MQWKLPAGIALGFGLSVGGAVWAAADGVASTDQVPRVVPYDGVLEFNGNVVHGQTNLRFALFAWDESMTGAYPSSTPLWTEEWSNLGSKSCSATSCQVQVRQGRFAVQLGRHVDVMPAIAAADDVCLAIEVRGGGNWVPLGGCQRFTPAPYALWSAAGSNPQIAGDLTVNGALSAASVSTGPISAGDVTAAGTLSAARVAVTGPIYDTVRPTSGDLGLYSGNAGHHMRYVTNNAPHRFFVDGNTNANGGSPVFQITNGGRAQAFGGMQVTGGLSADTLSTGRIDGLSNTLRVTSEVSVARNNSGGSHDVSLGLTTSQAACFLTKAQYEDVDGGGEWARCHVYVSGSTWRLAAHLGRNDDSDAWCSARCIRWD